MLRGERRKRARRISPAHSSSPRIWHLSVPTRLGTVERDETKRDEARRDETDEETTLRE